MYLAKATKINNSCFKSEKKYKSKTQKGKKKIQKRKKLDLFLEKIMGVIKKILMTYFLKN